MKRMLSAPEIYLYREIIELDFGDHEKQCACCQHSLHKIGEDRSEKLEFSPAVLKVLEYVRPKYACRQCEQTEENNRRHCSKTSTTKYYP